MKKYKNRNINKNKSKRYTKIMTRKSRLKMRRREKFKVMKMTYILTVLRRYLSNFESFQRDPSSMILVE